jgi:hypothetical protein
MPDPLQYFSVSLLACWVSAALLSPTAKLPIISAFFTAAFLSFSIPAMEKSDNHRKSEHCKKEKDGYYFGAYAESDHF